MNSKAGKSVERALTSRNKNSQFSIMCVPRVLSLSLWLLFAHFVITGNHIGEICNYMIFSLDFTLKFITSVCVCVCVAAFNGIFVAKIDNTECKLHRASYDMKCIS